MFGAGADTGHMEGERRKETLTALFYLTVISARV